jgi:hypothetical protein
MIVGKKYGAEMPNILFDGIKSKKVLDADGNYLPGNCISIINNKGQSIVTMDVEHMFKDMVRADDLFKCGK